MIPRWCRQADPDGRRQLSALIWVVLLGLFTHPLLDLMTPYGTQLLAPFSDHRFAFNAMAIIDPLYTLPLLIAGLLGLIWPERRRRAVRAAALALLLSNAFLAYSWWWNHRVEEIADAQLTANGVRGIEVTAYPTIFQTFLRRIVAVSDDRVRVGFHTPFNDVPIRWRGYRPAAHPLILQFDDSPEGQLLRWFAMDQVAHIVTATAGGDLLQAYDIRYGLPGDPRQGLWGIRVLYGGDGAVLEPARRFSIDRGDALNDNLARLWWGIIGDVRGGFLVGDD